MGTALFIMHWLGIMESVNGNFALSAIDLEIRMSRKCTSITFVYHFVFRIKSGKT